MPPHSINLRGPWNLLHPSQTTTAPTPAGQPQPRGERIELPFSFSQGPFPVRLERFFHRPTGLEPQDTVQLVIESDIPPTHFWINQRPAEIQPRHQSWIADVTSLLHVRNLLELHFQAPENPREPAGTLFAVRVLILPGS